MRKQILISAFRPVRAGNTAGDASVGRGHSYPRGRTGVSALPRALAGRLLLCLCAAALLPLGALAQTSPNYQNREHVVNSGGNPADAAALTSTNYKVTLSSIGEGLTQTGMSSPGYTMDGGFVPPIGPPGEVLDLQFSSKTVVGWDPEPSVGTYSVYKSDLTGIRGGNYGACFAQNLTATSAADTDTPTAGQCFTYLITAENRLFEEGTLGRDSSGMTRPNTSPCP